MADQDSDQVANWNSQSGKRWVTNQARLDAVVAAFGRAAIEAAAPAKGERVLDAGCGAGASSLALAARVGPAGQVLGVDRHGAKSGNLTGISRETRPLAGWLRM